MEHDAIVILVLSLLATASTLFGLGVVYPASVRSLFRYKLWRKRDALVDDLLAQRLPKCAAVLRTLERTERLIGCSGEISLVRWIAIPMPPEQYLREEKEWWERELRHLSASDRKRLEEHSAEVEAALHNFLVLSSPVGLAIALLTALTAIPIIAVVSLVRAFRSPWGYGRHLACVAKARVEEWLVRSRLSSVDELSSRTDRKPLSLCM